MPKFTIRHCLGSRVHCSGVASARILPGHNLLHGSAVTWTLYPPSAVATRVASLLHDQQACWSCIVAAKMASATNMTFQRR